MNTGISIYTQKVWKLGSPT